MCSSLECSEVLTMGGARMMEEVGGLELGDGLPEGKLQKPFYGVRMSESEMDLLDKRYFELRHILNSIEWCSLKNHPL